MTVGGAVANDVHGKNHHAAGTFGEHVLSLQLTRTDGRRIRCAPDENPDYLAATIGGLGLTGVIESARLRLRRVPGEWIDVESESFESLDEFLALSEKAKDAWEYSVAWIDCGPADAARRAACCSAATMPRPISARPSGPIAGCLSTCRFLS